MWAWSPCAAWRRHWNLLMAEELAARALSGLGSVEAGALSATQMPRCREVSR